MAYVAILALLMLASVLALAVSYRVGTQISLLDQRTSSLQADYLAESAANHAVWEFTAVGSVDRRVSTSTDDSREKLSDQTNWHLAPDPWMGQNICGTRFQNVQIPQGATILDAYVEFTSAEDDSSSTTVAIKGEDSDNPSAFASNVNDMYSRTRTTANVSWSNIPTWSKNGVYQTPQLRTIVQELVDRSGWSSGNSMVLLFEGSVSNGKRQAYHYDGDSVVAPRLRISYQRISATLDPNTYFMHSLAGGRYGYKVLEPTSTTLGTVATVGAHGSAVVKQGHVMRLAPEESTPLPCLRGWWTMDETSGLTAGDSSLSLGDGVLTNLAGNEWTSGTISGGIELSGSTDRIVVGNSANLQLDSNMSLSMWVKPNVVQNSLLIDKGFSDSYYMYLNSNGSFKLACASGGANWEVSSASSLITAGSWYHLAGTFDDTSNEAVLYLNGTEVARTTGISASISNNSSDLVIGASSPSGGLALNGYVDDVRVYGCALTPTEVSDISCPGLNPVADAGADQSVALGQSGVAMAGSGVASCPSGSVSLLWTQTSGPGTTTFVDATLGNTGVSFSSAGVYVLRLTVTEGTKTAYDEVSMTVTGSLYEEVFAEFVSPQKKAWRDIDLSGSPYNVPANAVVEVAIYNKSTGKEREGGVRRNGSSLNRKIDIHEAEGGGKDLVVMHVQTDDSSVIECYSEKTNKVQFYLLGYWTTGTYEELWSSFETDHDEGHGEWASESLSSHGVPSNKIAELVVFNTDSGKERETGMRESGSSLNRRVDIHESEGNGEEMVSMFVKTSSSASATIDVYNEDHNDLEFVVLGYWSTPPGTYTQAFATVSAPSGSNWANVDLSSTGAPAGAVAHLLLENYTQNNQLQVGARAVGSSIDRWFELHEAESGGGDFMPIHVELDGSSIFEGRKSSGSARYRVIGWWTP